MQLVTVTQKGQVTLPKKYRDILKIKTRSAVKIVPSGDHLKIYPTVDILDLAGKFSAPKGMTALKAREYMEKHYKRV